MARIQVSSFRSSLVTIDDLPLFIIQPNYLEFHIAAELIFFRRPSRYFKTPDATDDVLPFQVSSGSKDR
jgi:hypothetical protein